MKVNFIKINSLLLFLVVIITACQDKKQKVNSYNEMTKWADQYLKGTDKDKFKSDQPVNVQIDWHHPVRVFNDETVGYAMKMTGTNIKSMLNYLLFVDNKFEGRIPVK